MSVDLEELRHEPANETADSCCGTRMQWHISCLCDARVTAALTAERERADAADIARLLAISKGNGTTLAAQAERDGWRRVASRLEDEKQAAEERERLARELAEHVADRLACGEPVSDWGARMARRYLALCDDDKIDLPR